MGCTARRPASPHLSARTARVDRLAEGARFRGGGVRGARFRGAFCAASPYPQFRSHPRRIGMRAAPWTATRSSAGPTSSTRTTRRASGVAFGFWPRARARARRRPRGPRDAPARSSAPARSRRSSRRRSAWRGAASRRRDDPLAARERERRRRARPPPALVSSALSPRRVFFSRTSRRGRRSRSSASRRRRT